MASRIAAWLTKILAPPPRPAPGTSSDDEPKPVAHRLVPFAGDEGQGFYVERDDGQRLHWRNLPRTQGLESVPVMGVSYRMVELQDPAFAPGSELALVREHDNEHDANAIGIWDRDRRNKIGYVPREDARRIARKLARGEIVRCISMWEMRDGERRVALRILLIGPQARVGSF